ncbi:hypothetical protein [Duffyella gerundensis]|uniref:hypothetical protein n=1 Tax=Duffyella gerundensis TaxID=1619313 RepID=UPI001CE37781|nr:hypothetical protein [Duffyella gerundensis]
MQITHSFLASKPLVYWPAHYLSSMHTWRTASRLQPSAVQFPLSAFLIPLPAFRLSLPASRLSLFAFLFPLFSFRLSPFAFCLLLSAFRFLLLILTWVLTLRRHHYRRGKSVFQDEPQGCGEKAR